MWPTPVLTFKRLPYKLLSLRSGFDYSNLFCSRCMYVFQLLTFTLSFLLFTWLSFVSCNLFVYGCSLSRTPLKTKLLVSKVWFVLVNLSIIENSTTSTFKDVQGSTIFLIPLLDDNEFCLLKMPVSRIFSHLQCTFKNNLENFHLSSCIVLYSLCVFTFLFLMLPPLKILWYCNGFFQVWVESCFLHSLS